MAVTDDTPDDIPRGAEWSGDLPGGIKIQSFRETCAGNPESWHHHIKRRFLPRRFGVLNPVEDGGVFLQTAALLSVLPGDTPKSPRYWRLERRR